MHFWWQWSFFDKSSSRKLKLKIALRLTAFAAKTRTFQVSRRGWAELHHVNVTGPRQRGVGVRRYHRHHPTPNTCNHCTLCTLHPYPEKIWRNWTKSVAVAVVVVVGPHWTSGFTAVLMGEGWPGPVWGGWPGATLQSLQHIHPATMWTRVIGGHSSCHRTFSKFHTA